MWVCFNEKLYKFHNYHMNILKELEPETCSSFKRFIYGNWEFNNTRSEDKKQS